MVHDNDNNDDGSSSSSNTSSRSNLPPGFNPLNYNAAADRTGPPRAGSFSNRLNNNKTNVISLRQTQMQQIMGQLLTAVSSRRGSNSNDDAVQVILNEHRDFLLEPLDNDQSVQGDDSIYAKCSTRAERYQVFSSTMEERIARARDPSTRQVLSALQYFVLDCE